MKKKILRLLGRLDIIDYCPKHDMYRIKQGYYEERSFCRKCKAQTHKVKK